MVKIGDVSKEGKWIVYVAEHSPLPVADIIAYDLYDIAKERGYTKNDVIQIAGLGYNAEFIAKLLISHQKYYL